MRMTVRKRVLASFVGMALFVGVLGCLGLSAAKQTQRAYEGGAQDYETIVRVTQSATDAQRNIMAVMALGIVTAFLLAHFISRNISTPITALREATREIGQGRFDTDIDVTTHDEIGELASSFKRMATDLHEARTALENEREQVEIARRFSERIVRAVPSALVALDSDGVILSTNPAFVALFQREGLDQPLRGLVSDVGLLRAIDRARMGEETSLELQLDLPQNPSRTLAVNVAPLLPAATREQASCLKGDSRARVLVALEDITDTRRLVAAASTAAGDDRKRAADLAEAYFRLKQAQARLIQQEKLTSMGQLSAGIAHEIRNRLSAISTCHHAIKTILELPEHPVLARMSAHIEREISRGAQTVSDLMIFARPSDPERTPCTVEDLVQEVLPLLSQEMAIRQIQVDNRTRIDSPSVLVDKGQLQQVLFNLLLNSQQAMDEQAVAGREHSIRLETQLRGSEVLIEVSDTGPGIAPKDLPRVFDPFFTTKEPGAGSGLGLSISYGIIERHGGTIEVRSHLDKGATFTIRLPVLGE